MGLDTVELVMEVEDAFDVEIPDDRAGQMLTVGDLYDFIVESKRDVVDPRGICLSAATFFAIRRALISEIDILPRSLRPRTSVQATLPTTGRRTLWAKLQSSLDLKLPTLCRPKWLVAISTALAIIATLLVSVLVYQEWGPNHAVWIGILSLVLIGVIASLITAPFATLPRPIFVTFRGLSNVVLAHNYAKLSQKFNTWNPADVWDALQIIIVEQLGVNSELVTKDASFVKDLGAD